MFTSAIDAKCALYLAVALFNEGYTESLKNICDLAGINFNLSMTNQRKNFDSLKLYHKKIQNIEKVQVNLRKLKQKKYKNPRSLCTAGGDML